MEKDEDCRLRWTKPQIFKFIDLVRQHSQLWNIQNKNFRNQYQRDLAYDKISYEMETTNEVVKKKIHILRSQYINEVKKMQKDPTKKSIWPYFDAMKFFYEPHLEDDGDESQNIITQLNHNNYDSDDEDDDDHSTMTLTSAAKKPRLDPTPIKWNRSKTMQLIETYQKYPELYNSNCFDFRNKYKRKLALENVAQQMGTTTEVIRKKMHALRTMYTTEMRKMKMKNSKQPRWSFFNAIKFLYDEAYYVPRPRYNVGEIKINANDDNALDDLIEYALEEEDYQAEYVDIDYEGSESTAGTTNQTETLSSISEEQTTTRNCCSSRERNEFVTFGETVASELRLTKDHETIHKLLKEQILEALEEAKVQIAALNE